MRNKAGECRWDKDGTPVGMYEDKYEWAGDIEKGDFTIRVREASEECVAVSGDRFRLYTEGNSYI